MEAKIARQFENMRKKVWRKSMLKFDALKLADADYFWRFWLDFWSGLGERGLPEYRQKSRLDFSSNLTRLASQAGCGG